MANEATRKGCQRVGELLGRARRRLASLDAELLLAHATARSRTWLLTWPEAAIDADTVSDFERLVAERARGMPLAYLTGQREFWSMTFQIDRHTLVPRPETERLVELTLELGNPAGTILELGTGCGAVACALGRERPDAGIVATDISAATLDVARRNCRTLQVDIGLVQTDWLAAFGARCADTIVSNPPYIPIGDIHLGGDGVAFEPRLALTAGVDGLDAYRRIAPGAARCLRQGGYLLLEHGCDQTAAVTEILRQAGFVDAQTHADAAGQARITTARLD